MLLALSYPYPFVAYLGLILSYSSVLGSHVYGILYHGLFRPHLLREPVCNMNACARLDLFFYPV